MLLTFNGKQLVMMGDSIVLIIYVSLFCWEMQLMLCFGKGGIITLLLET